MAKAEAKSKKAEKASEETIQTKSAVVTESDDNLQVTVEKKLRALYNLQLIDSHIDKIRIVRGELPLEVQDLEDEIAGLDTRIEKFALETEALSSQVVEKETAIKESQAMIKKYKEQQMNVRNNREYDSISKELEFQSLEIQLSEKRIKEFSFKLESIKSEVEKSEAVLAERKNDLDIKKNELEDIIIDTENEEKDLLAKSEENQKFVEERMVVAYQRIRKNARNGLAVVKIERDACGGCFNKIPPQHQLDIRMHKKIIVCEYCGRILVDDAIADSVE